MRYRRAVVLHSNIYNGGGAENYCVRILAILQRYFKEVTLVHTGGSLDVERIRSWSGIALDSDIVQFASPKFTRFESIIARLARRPLLEYALTVRATARMAAPAELIVSTFAECPLPAERLIQCIHAPLFVSDIKGLEYLGIRKSPLGRMFQGLYVAIAKWLMNWSKSVVGNHVTVTNSEWTAREFRRRYNGKNVVAVHHGVQVTSALGDASWVPFEERANRVVILGRVVPSKRVDEAIQVVERLRSAGHDLEAIIIGSGDGPFAQDMRRRVEKLPWVTWLSGLPREEVEKTIIGQKWGLHCCRHEHYGLAPAEMQALGCIVFAHRSGGQVEIINNQKQLFDDIDDAVSRIEYALSHPDELEVWLQNAQAAISNHTRSAHDQSFERILVRMMSDYKSERRSA